MSKPSQAQDSVIDSIEPTEVTILGTVYYIKGEPTMDDLASIELRLMKRGYTAGAIPMSAMTCAIFAQITGSDLDAIFKLPMSAMEVMSAALVSFSKVD